MSGGAGIGSPSTLGGGLYKEYKAEFDKLYAKQADIEDLNVLDKLHYQTYDAYWDPVVTDVSISVIRDSSNKITGVSLNKTRHYGIICKLQPPGR